MLLKRGQPAVHLCGERKAVQRGLYKQSHLWNVQNVHRGCAPSWGHGEEPPNPCVTGCLTKGVSKTQPVFSALAAVSALGLKITEVIRYQCGQYGVLFNATEVIINKTVNISPVPSSPFLKQARLPQLLATKCRQDIQSKVKKKLHTISGAVWVFCCCCFGLFSMTH